MIDIALQRYALLALASAALFGAAAPALKPIAAAMHPVLLAGLLYLGSFIGLFALRSVRGKVEEARLQRKDLPALAGAIVAGGLVAPVLLVWGLSGLTASAASLLLASEAVLTILVAALLFREAVAGRVWVAALLILGAAALLAWVPGTRLAFVQPVRLVGRRGHGSSVELVIRAAMPSSSSSQRRRR